MIRVKMLSGFLVLSIIGAGGTALADQPIGPVPMVAEINARAITSLLHQSKAGERSDLSGKFLAYLDLSDLDFKGAILARSDFYGTDFTGANLSGADLSQTRLDRSVLIRANLSGANLAGATILRPTVYSDMTNRTSEAPRFSGANLRNVHVQAELSGSDFRGADLTDADFYPLEGRPGQGTITTLSRNTLKYCDFSGARLHKANMERAVLWFAKFTGADLTGTRFVEADLSRADFAGADLAGADFTGADLDGANFIGAKGLEEAVGLDRAINLDRALR
jgi:uncharacterized protein YjbI with pentapeptide repeats